MASDDLFFPPFVALPDSESEEDAGLTPTIGLDGKPVEGEKSKKELKRLKKLKQKQKVRSAFDVSEGERKMIHMDNKRG